MNSEHHIRAFFTAEFEKLGERKKKAGGKACRQKHPVRGEIETTFNIACEVLGSEEANALADKNGL